MRFGIIFLLMLASVAVRASTFTATAVTNSGPLVQSGPVVITNIAAAGLIVTNPASHTFTIILTNGTLMMNGGILAGGIYHTNGISLTNNTGESLNLFWDGTAFWRDVPQDWSAGSGLLWEAGSDGGFSLVSGDNLASVQVQGHGTANVLIGGTLTASGNFVEQGSSSLDNGAITTDGSGDLTIGKLSSDGGSISSDGIGDLSAASVSGNGNGLFNLPASHLLGTLPQNTLPSFVITNANTTRFTNAAAFTNTSTADITGTISGYNGIANYTTNYSFAAAAGYTNTSGRSQYINVFGTAGSNVFYMRGGAHGGSAASVPIFTNINTANGGGYALGVNCGVQLVNGSGVRIEVYDFP